MEHSDGAMTEQTHVYTHTCLFSHCSIHPSTYLLRVGLLFGQRAGLFVQSVDDGPVAGDLLSHVLVLLDKGLRGELVVAHVGARHDAEHVQHPGVDVVGVSQELVMVAGLLQAGLPVDVYMVPGRPLSCNAFIRARLIFRPTTGA